MSSHLSIDDVVIGRPLGRMAAINHADDRHESSNAGAEDNNPPANNPPVNNPPASPDLAHFKDVVAMLKDRWASLPAESRERLDHLNDPSNPQRDEAMQEFKETWAGAAEKDTGRLASVDQFNLFANKHLANIKRRIGWAPNLSSEDNAIIFEAIQALDTATEGIDLKGYGRYHACLKTVV